MFQNKHPTTFRLKILLLIYIWGLYEHIKKDLPYLHFGLFLPLLRIYLLKIVETESCHSVCFRVLQNI